MLNSSSSRQQVHQSAKRRGRTGCVRCRARKRKCDESKPRCRFCESKNIDCEYAPVGRFLAKNIHVLGQHERSLSAVSGVQNLVTSPEQPQVNYLNDQYPNDQYHERNGNLEAQEDHLMSAVDGLIELGNWTSNVSNEATPTQYTASIPSPMPNAPFTPQSVQHHMQTPQMPSERKLELLVYFRYHVAPSLDICDMSQSFGLCVPELLNHSESATWAVLALSSALKAVKPSSSESNVDESVQLLRFASNLESNSMHTASISVSSILVRLCEVIVRLPTAWSDEDDQGPSLIESTGWTYVGGPKGLYWHLGLLCARLDLSVALIRSTTVVIARLEPECSMDVANITMDSDRYSQQAILLCMEAVNICFGSVTRAPSGLRTEAPFVERWGTLLQRLRSWFEWRPRVLLPVLDVASNNAQTDPFPFIICTTGQGILGNQLYHTAMLLLLQCRPRTLKVSRLSADLSPLWHAERICGIAMNNNRRECWDPSLVASLFVAARRMTHVMQQRALLNIFRRMPLLVGIDMAALLTSLKEQWGLADIPDIGNQSSDRHANESATPEGT